MSTYRVKTQPTTEPVSVTEAKAHLRIDDTDSDTYIEGLIKAARQMCEHYTGLSFITQTREAIMDKFPCGSKDISLPYGPVISVTSVTYTDSDGDAVPLTANDDYRVDIYGGRIQAVDGWFDTDGSNNAVIVEYVAGYANAAAVPQVIKQAILFQVAAMYENRGDAGDLTYTSWNLLDTVKVFWYAD